MSAHRRRALSLCSCIAAALFTATLVTSCGQKGPLYLPDEQKEPVRKSGIPIPVSKEEKNRNKEESKAP